MAEVRIVLNREGVRALLRSPEMQSICTQHACAARSRLGDGYEVTSYTGKNRVNASIKAVSRAAKRDNARNNTILKALQ